MATALLVDLPAPSGQDAASAAEHDPEPVAGTEAPAPTAYGDSAYGTGVLLADLEERGVAAMLKVAPATAPAGRFPKDQFTIDLDAQTVTCPARLTVAIIPRRDGGGLARFGRACAVCPLASGCTSSRAGRTISIHRHEVLLTRARQRQRDPAWRADYRAHRPPRSNASWRTCSAADMAGAGPACAGCCGSGRTGGCWPPRSTSPAWPCSACTPNQTGGGRASVGASQESLHILPASDRPSTIAARPRSDPEQPPAKPHRAPAI
jgi:Transposase DDE domain